MAQLGCFNSLKLCAMRVIRLDADCTFDTAANNAVVTSAAVSLATTPEYEEGEEFLLENGCGDICVNLKDCDRLKRMNLEMMLCTRDFELIEILTGDSALLGRDLGVLGDYSTFTMGNSRRGIGFQCPGYFSLELWSRVANNQDCFVPVGGEAVPQWFRYVYPRATLTLQEVTLENAITEISLSGFSLNNPRWGQGPVSASFPLAAGIDANTPEAIFLDPAGPPTTQCGWQTIAIA
jgi:hypothetical protein